MTAAASAANLRLASYDDIGEHYAVTLRLWRERMMARAETVLGLGYSRKFLRMFEFYFAYCEAGFAHRLIHDLQMTWVKDGADAADDPRSIATASATARASVRERDASWFLAAISLVRRLDGARVRDFAAKAPAMFVAVAAAAAAHFFILVAVAAALAAIGAPDTTTDDALLARAARTARPLTSDALFAAAAPPRVARRGRRHRSIRFADHLSAARTSANEHRLAAVAVAASGAPRRASTIAAVTASTPAPGVTRSSRRSRVGSDVARVATCAWALCGEQYLPAVAFSVLAAAHAGAEHFRRFAKICVTAFPHGDSALRRVSFPPRTAAAAFLVARFAPHAAAAAALTPRAVAAVVAVAPKTPSALAGGVLAGVRGGAAAWSPRGGGGVTERGSPRSAAAPVALAAAAAAACAADVAAFATAAGKTRGDGRARTNRAPRHVRGGVMGATGEASRARESRDHFLHLRVSHVTYLRAARR